VYATSWALAGPVTLIRAVNANIAALGARIASDLKFCEPVRSDIVLSVEAVAPPMIAPALRASDPSGRYNLRANSSAVKYRRFMTRCTQNRMGIGIRMWPGPAKPS
jgi:hypothetical protein